MKTIREHVRECAYKEIEELKKKYSYDLSLFRIAEREALRDNDKTFDEVLRVVAIAKEFGLDFGHVRQKTENWTKRQRVIEVWFKNNGVLGYAKNQAYVSIKDLIEKNGVLGYAKNQAYVSIKDLIEKNVSEVILSELNKTKVSEWCDELGNPIVLIKYTKNE